MQPLQGKVHGLGQFEQLQPPGEGHGHAQGELVRRGDIDDARPGAHAAGRAHIHAFLVHRHGHEIGPGADEGPARAAIARILDPDRVLRINQHAGREVETGLSAGGDDHLVRLADNTAGELDVGDDGFAQIG